MGDGAGHHRRPSADVALALGGARTEPGGAEPAEGESERTEAFVVRIALTARGRPLRSTVTHVRSLAEHASPGWEPLEIVRFMEACLWMASRMPPSVMDGPQVVDQDVGP